MLDAAVLLDGPPAAWDALLAALKPGAAVLAALNWRDVCRAEDAGLEVKDGLVWVRPGQHTRLMLGRKALDGTLSENTIRWGVGGINIGACRNGLTGGTTRANQSEHYSQGGWRTGHDIVTIDAGRWPTNMILQHGLLCQLLGTKTVGTGEPKTNAQTNRQVGGKINTPKLPNQTDSLTSYGQEEVEEWDCQDGCPIRQLDHQSGFLKGGVTVKKNAKGQSSGMFGFKFQPGPDFSYGDEGGASRFFTCLPPDPIALPRHLLTLIVPPGGHVLIDSPELQEAADQGGWHAHDSLATEARPVTMGSP
jgi:hypothetical protein